MSDKSRLKREIAESESTIKAFEEKRARSQSALITAMLKKEQPDPKDEEFFNMFSALIDAEREKLRSLTKQLKELTGKDDL